jgi:hypothetical protein
MFGYSGLLKEWAERTLNPTSGIRVYSRPEQVYSVPKLPIQANKYQSSVDISDGYKHSYILLKKEVFYHTNSANLISSSCC